MADISGKVGRRLNDAMVDMANSYQAAARGEVPLRDLGVTCREFANDPEPLDEGLSNQLMMAALGTIMKAVEDMDLAKRERASVILAEFQKKLQATTREQHRILADALEGVAALAELA